MIQLTPPILYGRKQWLGITSRIDINGKWENVEKVISQDFGNNSGPFQAQYEAWGLLGHSGTDIVTYSGDPIIASHNGIVFDSIVDSMGGIGLDIWAKEEKYKTRYWHNLQNLVKVGEEVKRGQLIAYSDSTGFSSSSHVHFALKLTDDMGNTINKDNGYLGAINDIPYRTNNIMGGLLTSEQVKQLYHMIWFREPESEALQYWTNKSFEQFYSGIMISEEREYYKPIIEMIKRLEKWSYDRK